MFTAVAAEAAPRLPRPAAAGEGAVQTATAGGVAEVDKDSFHPALDAAGDRLVVLDMYTQWCGPCKLIAPKLDVLSGEYMDVVFLKLDCNLENKPLAKELGIKTVPTFKLFKRKEVVGQVTGAKYDALLELIDENR
eukprot:SM000249S08240  [mRNA]  locus=s249:13273:14359:+ [translate_table: standard]